jgi:hypothetical protein
VSEETLVAVSAEKVKAIVSRHMYRYVCMSAIARAHSGSEMYVHMYVCLHSRVHALKCLQSFPFWGGGG